MDLLLKCLMSFSFLVFLGSLLALVATLLPALLDYLEPAPPGTGLGLGPRERTQAPPAAPTGMAAAPEPAPPRPAPAMDDPALAAAVGLALCLFLEGGGRTAAPPPPLFATPGSTWSLAGRWQAMQARRDIRKR